MSMDGGSLDVIVEEMRALRESVDAEKEERISQREAIERQIEENNDNTQKILRAENQRRIRPTWGAVLLVLLLLVTGKLDSNSKTERLDDIVQQIIDTRLASRGADCRSLDAIGEVIKGGVAIIENDPSASPQAVEFVRVYKQAVDNGIADVKSDKGYTNDCSRVDDPPPTSTSSSGG